MRLFSIAILATVPIAFGAPIQLVDTAEVANVKRSENIAAIIKALSDTNRLIARDFLKKDSITKRQFSDLLDLLGGLLGDPLGGLGNFPGGLGLGGTSTPAPSSTGGSPPTYGSWPPSSNGGSSSGGSDGSPPDNGGSDGNGDDGNGGDGNGGGGNGGDGDGDDGDGDDGNPFSGGPEIGGPGSGGSGSPPGSYGYGQPPTYRGGKA